MEVRAKYDAVKLRRTLNHDHGRTVDELVLDLQIWEFSLENLIHNLPPKPARRQHIRLVQRSHSRISSAAGEIPAQPCNTLNLWAGVRLRIPRLAGTIIVLLTRAKVDATRKLADHENIRSAADGGLKGRGVDEGVGGEEAGPEVTVGAHLLAQLQQALLRADGAGAPFRAADGAEKDGVGGLGGGEGFVCEGGAGLVDGAL